MLRIAFLVVLLANALFFVWSQGYLGGIDSGREPQRLLAQVATDKLRVIPAAAVAADPRPAAPQALLCRRVSGLGAEGIEALATVFRGKLPGLAVTGSVNENPGRVVVGEHKRGVV